MERKWIILHNCPDATPAWWNEKEGKRTPVFHDTQKEAVKTSLEHHISRLSEQLEDLDNDYIEPDEVDWESDEWVEECTIDESGCISTETEGVIYNPKTFVR